MTQPTDIVERLELFEVSDALGDGDFSVCIEAAAEITRLRAELAEAELRGVKAGLEKWNRWYDTATADDDCEYLNGEGWGDAAKLRAIDPTTLLKDADHGE